MPRLVSTRVCTGFSPQLFLPLSFRVLLLTQPKIPSVSFTAPWFGRSFYLLTY